MEDKKQKETRLIMEFMGVKEQRSTYEHSPMQISEHYKTSNGVFTTSAYSVPDRSEPAFISMAKYDSDWTWLMPVVEKMSSLVLDEVNGCVCYTPYMRTFGMKDEDGLFMVRINGCVLFKNSSLLLATYEAVIDFLEWWKYEYKPN